MAIKKTKLEDQELQEIKQFQSDFDQLQVLLGQIQLQKFKLDNDELILKSKYNDLLFKEKELGEQLNNKYGEVQIDLKTGEITDSKDKS
jgi:sulfur relay (sulfurtransferase) DsrF/TusC family protein